ncbi:MAG: carboxylesterase family protein [Desulfobacteraceae bacterium]|nr:carboxylesterase family protein [Desulfobacteraceae bacterium]
MVLNRQALKLHFKTAALLFVLFMMFAAMSGCSKTDETATPVTPAATPAPVALVNTQNGQISGLEPNANTNQWLGVPYAKPPVGDLRWRPPVAPDAWSGVLDCSGYKPQAAQHTYFANFGQGGVSEDCLYLNITAPKNANNLPVMFWIHGGFFSILTANVANYNNAEALPTKDVVVVTVNHRLGPFGYLAHPSLRAESADGLSGNYGQLDLIMALQWVRDNIEAFGGNPDNVTIFGQSGGGAKVLSLLTSSLAQGLFHKAIVQSGMSTTADPSIQPLSLVEAENEGADFATALGLNGASASAAAMRAISWETIVTTVTFTGDTAAATNSLPQVIYSPTIDGYYLTNTAANIFTAGNQVDVPLMTGVTWGDGQILTGGFQELIPTIADGYDTAGSSNPIYTYVFNHLPLGWRGITYDNNSSPNDDRTVLAYHAVELAYLFKSYNSFLTHWAMGLPYLTVMTTNEYQYQSPPGTYPNRAILNLSAIPTTDTSDSAMVDLMMTMWANFAATGNPNLEGQTTWQPYTSTSDQYLQITILTPPTLEDNLNTLVFPTNPI